ncbi:STAS domain-containing protein, partial [uncultured Sphingomonas sp.]|uniref:STAS domain-containing protein n=1 Tax=uncultured Sphingomonas sp. TaxID=158754 RepID=UPI0025E28780
MDLHAGTSATLRNAAELRQQCIEKISDSGPIIIDVSAVTEADLSLVQSIHALRVAAAEAGREVRLGGPAPAAVVALLERAGFLAAPSPQDLD